MRLFNGAIKTYIRIAGQSRTWRGWRSHFFTTEEASMSKRITRTFRVAFAALVAASLTFGAGSVLASPPAACSPGVFTCSTVADCNAKCPFPAGNICRLNGCCLCST
jgi:hypothetical protein